MLPFLSPVECFLVLVVVFGPPVAAGAAIGWRRGRPGEGALAGAFGGLLGVGLAVVLCVAYDNSLPHVTVHDEFFGTQSVAVGGPPAWAFHAFVVAGGLLAGGSFAAAAVPPAPSKAAATTRASSAACTRRAPPSGAPGAGPDLGEGVTPCVPPSA